MIQIFEVQYERGNSRGESFLQFGSSVSSAENSFAKSDHRFEVVYF